MKVHGHSLFQKSHMRNHRYLSRLLKKKTVEDREDPDGETEVILNGQDN